MIHHPRIFLAGCGFTGERCADFFSHAGWEVTALVATAASADRLANKPYRVIAADVATEAGLRALPPEARSPDILIHCLSGYGGRDAAAYLVTYVETLRHLLNLLTPGFSVFTSSTSVYPQNDGSTVSEESPTGGTPTGDVLLEAERLATASGGATVRLGGIYGPGRARFVQSVLAGEALPQGAPDGLVNLIHRDDAAQALFHVANHRLSGVFNAVDDHPAPRGDLARNILTALGHGQPEAPTNTIPSTGKRVSNAKLRSTGWTPKYPSIAAAVLEDDHLRHSLGLTGQASTQSR